MSTNLRDWAIIKRAVVGVLVFLAALAPLSAHAEDVVLNPGYISGTVTVGSETISYGYIYAYWTAPDGTSYQASTNFSTGGSYSLTVNVPEGTTPSYTVNGYVYMNNSQYYMQLPSQTVDVTALLTSTADFSISPGYVTATVTATGGSLSSGQFYASSGGGYSYGSANIFGQEATLTFPVFPDESVSVSGYVYLNGGYINLDSQPVSVNAGETVAVSWTVTPPAQGAIGGTFQFNGATADRHDIYASGPSSAYQTLTDNGDYLLSGLNVGSYYMYAYSYFDNYSTYLQLPDSSFSPDRYPTVADGTTTDVDITTTAAFIQGKITLTGTKTLSQANYASLSSYGVYQTNAYGGYANTSPNLQTGAYRLVVTDGDWSVPYQLSFQFYNSDPYLSSSLYLYDYQSQNNPISVAAGETATRNLTYGTGTVTVNYSVVGGGTLSNPYLTRYCTMYDQNNQLIGQYYVNAYGNQVNVTQGSVTFVGMGATCSLDARATVGTSDTSFGLVNVQVVPGADQVVDIGGPALTISFPEAGYITSNADIVVTGSATDDVAMGSVTVNGASADLTPPAPAAQVVFASSSIPLSLGPNQIVTVATDESGKSASDTRTVYRDDGPPSLAWTPVDGSFTTLSEITVVGTATDDAGIASITVNGVTVFQSATPGSGPSEQTFSAQVPLSMGENFLVVVVTDISTRMTAQTHKVTRTDQIENKSPICSAATASPASLWPPNHQMVPISILGVTDPDGNAVTITATSVRQDELVKATGTGSGSTSPDATLSPLAVRAERDGTPKAPGNGRVYHMNFTADDGQGGACNGSVTVCVPHDQRPGSTCVDGGPLYDSLTP